MKKFLTILNFLLLVTLIILTLYIFDVIDIPWLQNQKQTTQPVQQQTVGQDQQTEHGNETEKVARRKPYRELIKKGDLYYNNEFYNLALDSYIEAGNQKPDETEPLLRIGKVHLVTKNYTQAKNVAQKILDINSHSVDGKLMLGKAYIGLEEFNDAKNILDGITTDDQDVLYYQGIIALYFGEHERGENLLRSAAENNTNSNLTEKAQNFIDALNEFRRYQAGLESHLKVLLARSYVKNNHPKMAKELLWTVLDQQRDYRDAWIILGYSYLKLSQFQEAVDALEEAKRQDPEKPQTLFYLGLAYAGNDQPEQSIENLNLALENGYEPRVHVEQKLAELYFQQQEYDKASDAYENVLSLNSTNLDYFVRPVWIYIDVLNQPKNALNLAEKAHLHHPDDPMAYNLLGWAYVANRDFINGKKNLEKAIEINENFDAPYLNLGWMYEQQKNFSKAMELYKKAYHVGKNTSIGDLAAKRYNALLDKEREGNIMVNIF